jgi:hypothetical protein
VGGGASGVGGDSGDVGEAGKVKTVDTSRQEVRRRKEIRMSGSLRDMKGCDSLAGWNNPALVIIPRFSKKNPYRIHSSKMLLKDNSSLK